MNNERRKVLREAIGLLEQASALAEQAADLVESVRDEEQDIYDSLPENFQQAERGETMQAAISALESVELDDPFGDAISNIEEAIG